MDPISKRIKSVNAHNYIDLLDAEFEHYEGAGWAVAGFNQETLAGMFYAKNIPQDTDLNDYVISAFEWAQQFDAAFLVMASSYQLCHLQKITKSDVTAVASVTRRFSEEIVNP